MGEGTLALTLSAQGSAGMYDCSSLALSLVSLLQRTGVVTFSWWAGFLVSPLCLFDLFAPGFKELCSQPVPDQVGCPWVLRLPGSQFGGWGAGGLPSGLVQSVFALPALSEGSSFLEALQCKVIIINMIL